MFDDSSYEKTPQLYIDFKNYDVHTFKPKGIIDIDYISVDELIANTISLLNKKGYITTYSCQGRNLNENILLFDYDEVKGDYDFILFPHPANMEVYKVSEQVYKIKTIKIALSPYVFFKPGIILPFIPDGFEKRENNNAIYGIIKCYSETDGKLFPSSRKLVKKRIEILNMKLELWARKLPDYEYNSRIGK